MEGSEHTVTISGTWREIETAIPKSFFRGLSNFFQSKDIFNTKQNLSVTCQLKHGAQEIQKWVKDLKCEVTQHIWKLYNVSVPSSKKFSEFSQLKGFKHIDVHISRLWVHVFYFTLLLLPPQLEKLFSLFKVLFTTLFYLGSSLKNEDTSLIFAKI